MALSNAERQRRFRERLKANANGSLYDLFVRERREMILEWLKEHDPGEPAHSALTAMLESPDGGINAERLLEEFRDMVGNMVVAERRKQKIFRKRRTRAEVAADHERREAWVKEMQTERQPEHSSVTNDEPQPEADF